MRPRPGFEGGPPNFLAGLGRIPPHFCGFEIGASPPPPIIDLRVRESSIVPIVDRAHPGVARSAKSRGAAAPRPPAGGGHVRDNAESSDLTSCQ